MAEYDDYDDPIWNARYIERTYWKVRHDYEEDRIFIGKPVLLVF